MPGKKPVDSAGDYFTAFIVVFLILFILAMVWFLINLWSDFMYKSLFRYLFCQESLLHHIFISLVVVFLLSFFIPLFSSIDHEFDIPNVSKQQ